MVHIESLEFLSDEDFGPSDKPNAGHYRIEWNNRLAGLLEVNAQGQYTWEWADDRMAAIFPRSRYSPLPATIHNLHPDLGMFGKMLDITTKEDFLLPGIKALSGLRVRPCDKTYSQHFNQLSSTTDSLIEAIDRHLDSDKVFTGTYKGPSGLANTPEFNREVVRQWLGRFSQRYSGKQIKLPCVLTNNAGEGAVLQPATDPLPFTHFLKFPSIGGRESDGVMEWLGLKMSEAVGLPTNKFGLVDQGRDHPPALVTERFDIPRTDPKGGIENQHEMLLLQDFYSIVGEDPLKDTSDRKMFRYDELLEGWQKFTKKHDPDRLQENTEKFLRRLFLAWAANDGDLHAKNFSTLMRVDSRTMQVKAVEFAPIYDSCVSVFNGLTGDRLFYRLNRPKGSMVDPPPPVNLNMNDFMAFMKSPHISVGGKPYCIFDTAQDAEKYIKKIVSTVAHTAVDAMYNPPPFLHDLKDASVIMFDLQLAAAICVTRAKTIGADVPDVEFDRDLAKVARSIGAKQRRDALGRDGDYYNGYRQAYARALEKSGRVCIPAKAAGGPS